MRGITVVYGVEILLVQFLCPSPASMNLCQLWFFRNAAIRASKGGNHSK